MSGVKGDQALVRLFQQGRYHAGATDDAKLSLREAAELLNLSLYETIDFFAGMGVKENIRVRDVMESI